VEENTAISEEPQEIIFSQRSANVHDGHWYTNLGYYAHDINYSAAGKYGRLCRLNLKTGALTVLLDDPEGTIRDPQVNYDGKTILFSYRKGGTDNFDLYEISIEGDGLRQLTSDKWDDIEPTYLPDGGIAFVSNRCKRWVPCYVTQVATIYRCDGDGSNIRPLSANVEHDNHPWMLNDGRVLYTRWEYSDRSIMHYHGLWSMNPDGTKQTVLYGNQLPGGLYIDAKPLPDSQKLVFIFSPEHGRTEHAGHLAIIDPEAGPDNIGAKTTIAKGNYRDPYPLSQTEFLVANGPTLQIIDIDGNKKTIYSVPTELAEEDVWAHEPRPVNTHRRQQVIADSVDLSKDTGLIVVMDTYLGRNMEGVERGSIKKLLVLEHLPIPTGFSGGMEPITYGGTYFINRILGTIPVEADGSVYAEVPANRPLQLVALDENDFSVKRMQSFLTVMPGETYSCVGCHENRNVTASNMSAIKANKRPPDTITPIGDMPETFDYPRDIQPIWNKYCLDCHDVDNRAGGVLMTSDIGPIVTHSYFMLSIRLQIADGRNLARSNYPPYKIGSSASYLINKVDGSHYDVTVSDHELRKIKLWIDASAPFAGTYAALGSGMFGSEMPDAEEFPKSWYVREADWPSVIAAREAMDRRCNSCHTGKMSLPQFPSDHRGMTIHHMPFYADDDYIDEWSWVPPWVREDNDLRPGSLEWAKAHLDPRNLYSHSILYNLSRPEKSVLLLAPLAKSAGGYGACSEAVFKDTKDLDHAIILKSIEEAKAEVERLTRFHMPNFQPPEAYIREMKRYGVLPENHDVNNPIDVYETDHKYWESLYPKPEIVSESPGLVKIK
jgi:Tol biopolymer transport system component